MHINLVVFNEGRRSTSNLKPGPLPKGDDNVDAPTEVGFDAMRSVVEMEFKPPANLLGDHNW